MGAFSFANECYRNIGYRKRVLDQILLLRQDAIELAQ